MGTAPTRLRMCFSTSLAPLGARAAALRIDRPALWLAERCHLRARIRLRRPSTDGAAGGATPEATISRLGRSGVAR